MTKLSDMELFLNQLAEYNVHSYDPGKKIYKYVSAETAKTIIRDNTLLFSSPKILGDNDFEMDLLIFNLAPDQQKELLKRVYKLLHPDIGNEEANAFLETGIGSKLIDSIDCKQMLYNSYLSLHSKYGLFCATTSNNNREMWNCKKYGDENKGFCIEYNLPPSNSNYLVLKVFYDKEFKPFNLYNSDGTEDNISFYRWAFTKRIRYEFEDEVRAITDKGIGIEGRGAGRFSKNVFTGIYYGEKTSQTDIDELECLLKNGYSFDKCAKAIY